MVTQKPANPVTKPAGTNAMNDLDLVEAMQEGLIDEPIHPRKRILHGQPNDIERRGGVRMESPSSSTQAWESVSFAVFFFTHLHDVRRGRLSLFPSPS